VASKLKASSNSSSLTEEDAGYSADGCEAEQCMAAWRCLFRFIQLLPRSASIAEEIRAYRLNSPWTDRNGESDS